MFSAFGRRPAPKSDYCYVKTIEELYRKSRGCPELKKATLATLKDLEKLDTGAVKAKIKANVLEYYQPLKIACETKKVPLMTAALDGIHKLMMNNMIVTENEYVAGIKDETLKNEKRAEYSNFIKDMIATMCACFDLDMIHEAKPVHMQLSKALIFAISQYDIHGKSITLIVQCYLNIHVASPSDDTQRTSHATLNQALTVIFQKMDTYTRSLDPNASQHERAALLSLKEHWTSSSALETSTKDEQQTEEDKSEQDDQDDEEEQVVVDEETENNEDKSEEIKENNVEEDKPSGGNDEKKTQTPPKPKVEDKEEEKPTQKEIVMKDDTLDEDDNASVTSGSSRVSTSSRRTRQSTTSVRRSRSRKNKRMFDNQYKDDAHRLVVGLCNLSTTKLNGESETQVELRSRLLGLQLIKSILETNRPVLQAHPDFFMAIKTPICLALLNNLCSSKLSLFHLAGGIFKSLFTYYRDYTKSELGAFLNKAFLKILESDNSSFKFKEMVIDILDHIVSDAQTIVDLFVNFDCSLTFVNIFERIVEDLSRITTTSIAEANWLTVAQEARLKDLSMQVLVRMVLSLTTWMDGKTEHQVSQDVVEKLEFEKHWRQKNGLKEGLETFQKGFKKGLQIFIGNGVIEDNPESIAKFLKNEPNLDKTQIGQCIGDRFGGEILEAFTSSFEFKGLTFMEALRAYLATFRIPGEGQMIDRVVKAFAKHYYEKNSDHDGFADAEAAYVLAYSVIMLHTELHSPAFGFRERMTFEQFKENNKGLNNEEDFPEDFLREIYEDVKSKEMKLVDSNKPTKTDSTNNEKSSEHNFGSTTDQKKFNFEKENVSIYQDTKPDIKKSKKKTSEYYVAVDVIHAKTMFEVSWGLLLKALSARFEDSNDIQVLSKVIEGYRASINIAAKFGIMHIGRHFVDSIAEFSSLEDKLTLWEPKNLQPLSLVIECSDRLLLTICDGWEPILSTFSSLEKLQSIRASPSIKNDQQMSELTPKQQQAAIEKQMRLSAAKQIMAAISMDKIDMAYDRSVDLDDESIIHFVRALCKVSDKELQEGRTFSLAKLIIVGNANISRVSVTWLKMWQPMSAHFIKVGSSSDQQIAMNAIDSIRQLAMKFVKREEETHFNFQRNFLKPFVSILKQQSVAEMRILVVDCAQYVAQLENAHLRSGWKSLLKILEVAGRDANVKIVRHGHGILQNFYRDYFDTLIENQAFEEIVQAFVSYGQNTLDGEIGLKSVDYLSRVASKLSEGAVIPLSDDNIFHGDDETQLSHWMAVLTGLATLTKEKKNLNIRVAAASSLKNLLLSQGPSFDTPLWNEVFYQVLCPIFDVVNSDNAEEWTVESFHRFVDDFFVEVFVDIYSDDDDCPLGPLIAPLFRFLERFNVAQYERTFVPANACIGALVTGLIKKGAMSRIWPEYEKNIQVVLGNSICESELNIFTPKKSRFEGVGSNSSRRASLSPEPAVVATPEQKASAIKLISLKCRIHKLLIEQLNQLIANHYDSIPESFFKQLIDILSGHASSLSILHSGHSFFYFLKDSLTSPTSDMYDCEIRTIQFLLTLCFQLLSNPQSDTFKHAHTFLKKWLPLLCRAYLRERTNPTLNSAAYIEVFADPIVFALESIYKLSDDLFFEFKALLYPHLCDLIVAKHESLRKQLIPIFKRCQN